MIYPLSLFLPNEASETYPTRTSRIIPPTEYHRRFPRLEVHTFLCRWLLQK